MYYLYIIRLSIIIPKIKITSIANPIVDKEYKSSL